ncbi:calcyclin-binding protein [Drosophila sulfurigaster albostrigata]|uniref:calcyclin-binding protein n=1 Tax=Drosophila sulfurigaster albostrigata TaxID=89887 RepID=UPI002D2188A8|nr:calcyclin-binding protein [Drosophila sulfurigaster albostrigata]
MSLEQLKADSSEFGALLEQAKGARVKAALTQAKAEVDREIINLEIKARLAAERQASGGTAGSDTKRYLHELTDYGWDQSAKFVKLFITLNGVQQCQEDAVTVNYTEHSLQLHVRDLNGKDFGLSVNNLLFAIDVAKSYRKIKTDMVAIYLKKAEEGQNWDVLTSIQKRLKQKADNELAKDNANPEEALVNIMKKMYNSGDSKTKQVIAKAWTESQEKARFGPDANSGPGGGLGGLGDLGSLGNL